jgi:mono/diheme cytochrome c family protein
MLLVVGAFVALAAGCGSEGVDVDSQADTPAAEVFAARCGGCHTLSAAGTQGSNGERPTGPNLDYRKETREQVLYAIRNGGFSGAIMPQNIAVGAEAKALAAFVAKYAGTKSTGPPSPKSAGQDAGSP